MSSSPFPHWIPAAFATALAAAAVMFVWLLGVAAPPPSPDVGEAARVLRVAQPLPSFALVDHRGERFDASRFEGRWSFVFFGYTFCPDVCPATLGNLRAVRSLLEEGEPGLDDVQFVLISIDPDRDTPERLTRYLPYFHEDFVGATGSQEELARVTGALGIYHARSDAAAPGTVDYLMDHSSAVLLVDPQARLFAVFEHPDEPAEMARAFGEIREIASGTP